MDVQLQELIDKIKKDGVASAETAAAEIIAEAEKKAAALVEEAHAKAADIIKTAKAETERLEKASIDAVSQAGRNLLISFRDGINAQLAAFIKTETEKAYSAELLKSLVPETVKLLASNPDAQNLSVLLNEKDLKALEQNFHAALKQHIADGIEIKADSVSERKTEPHTTTFQPKRLHKCLLRILIRVLHKSLKVLQRLCGRKTDSELVLLSGVAASVFFA